MYRVHLTEAQREELQRRSRTPRLPARTRDRREMVRLSDAGWRIPQIARHLRISEARVRFWIKRYLASDFDGLPDQPHLGQRSALTPEILAAVVQEVQRGEQTWTAAQIATWIAEQYGVTRAPAHVRRLVKRVRLAYKRTSSSLRHKQDEAAVMAYRADLGTLEKGGRGSA